MIREICKILCLSMFCILSAGVATSADLPKIVCIQCHGSMTGRLGDPVKLWQGSVHAENGIVCNSCHGGDPNDAVNAMSPARGFLGAPKEQDVPAFCGRCHVGVLQDYLSSAHGRALGAGGPNCVTCHGNHQVVRASLELINEKSCSRCHPFERARLIKAAMEETEREIAVTGVRIRNYREKGTDVERLEKGLFSLRNRFRSLFHNVDTEKVRHESAQMHLELTKLERELDLLDKTMANRRLVGGIAVVTALLAAVLLHLLRKTYD